MRRFIGRKNYVKREMPLHTEIYYNHCGYGSDDFKPCEIPGCSNPSGPPHHIFNRGMGGSKLFDFIENLMGLCFYHHNLYGEVKEQMIYLLETHRNFLRGIGKPFKESWFVQKIKYMKSIL